jgi:hypothetical protein
MSQFLLVVCSNGAAYILSNGAPVPILTWWTRAFLIHDLITSSVGRLRVFVGHVTFVL